MIPPTPQTKRKEKAMAKFTPGPTVAAVSGSIGGTTYSRNRYGAYMRFRAKPVIATSAAATQAKNFMTAASQAWRGLTAAQRLQWGTWAQGNPIIDNLGMPQILQGNSAYCRLATRLLQMGQALPTAPPSEAAPDALATMTITADIGAGTSEIAFTATPLAAGLRLWGYFAVVDSAGITYVQNLRKLCVISDAAQATDYDYQTDVEARFGTLSVGQVVIADVAVADEDTGLISGFLRAQATVVTT